MIASQVGAALKARLAALTFNPTIPVAWPNKDFTPSGDRYLAAAIVRATVTNEPRQSEVRLGFLPNQSVHTTPYQQEKL